MHRNKSASAHQFAMVPRAEIPRSSFKIEHGHKTTFDAGFLVPLSLDEIYPGDSFRLSMTIFCRIATPLFPVMDNLHLETFFFFVPNRLVWSNWQKFMGEQENPGDSISFSIPQIACPAGGYTANTIFDYMGLPCIGQVSPGLSFTHSALPLRGYNRIINSWFRDQNLQTSLVQHTGDGPDPFTDYSLFRRGKRHDYFTGALPFLQKGQPVGIPLSGDAPVRWGPNVSTPTTGLDEFAAIGISGAGAATIGYTTALATPPQTALGTNATMNLYADLSQATAAAINSVITSTSCSITSCTTSGTCFGFNRK